MSLFRVARNVSTRRHLAATAGQIVVFWGTFLWLLPTAIAALAARCGIEALHAPAAPTVGPVLFALCSGLGLWSAATMAVHGAGTPLPLATARHFVIRGPYRRLRNPMALAGIGQGIAVGVWRDDAWVLLYALAGSLVWHCLARPPEERDLDARFGAPWRAYRDRVPHWLPRLVPRPVERVLGALLVFWGTLLFVAACLHRQHVWPAAAWCALGFLPGLVLIDRRRDDMPTGAWATAAR